MYNVSVQDSNTLLKSWLSKFWHEEKTMTIGKDLNIRQSSDLVPFMGFTWQNY